MHGAFIRIREASGRRAPGFHDACKQHVPEDSAWAHGMQATWVHAERDDKEDRQIGLAMPTTKRQDFTMLLHLLLLGRFSIRPLFCIIFAVHYFSLRAAREGRRRKLGSILFGWARGPGALSRMNSAPRGPQCCKCTFINPLNRGNFNPPTLFMFCCSFDS